MPDPMIQLEYHNVLDRTIGKAHGLTLGEIKRAEADVKTVVARVERERKDGLHRYRELPRDAEMLKTIKAAVRKFRPGVENLVVLGIGGSALGNVALQTALNDPYYQLHANKDRRGPRLFVMDNVDPVQIAGLIELLGPALRKTLFNVISKSGETAETAAQYLLFRDMVAKKLGRKSLARNIIVTTDPEQGTLRSMVEQDGYYALPVPPGVGGRFSVLSSVGLFSAAMCGIKIDKLLAGAADMGERVALRSVRKNPAAMLALILHAYYVRGKRLHVMMPYSFQLKDLADWYRQLWAESLGKQHDAEGRPQIIGPTPIKALGATDQHSQVQLYREGPNDKVFIFLEVDKFAKTVKVPRQAGIPAPLQYLPGASFGTLLNSEKLATEHALAASQRPCLTIRFPRVSEATIGQFIMLWEAATTITGQLLNLNPYDQPAVQMGKDFTYALMGKAGYKRQARELAKAATNRGKYVV